MEISDWQFAESFEEIRQRALRFGLQHQCEFHDKSAPFIEWTGNAKHLNWLSDPKREPPQDVINIRRAQPLEEFVCWLMLPKDFASDQWYFGRVFTRRRSLRSELAEFRAIASEAGKLLRQDSAFRDYLSPCLAHLQLASRFQAFHDHLDESYWCALLFTRPTLTHPIQFPFEKTIAGDLIGVASILNPFALTAKVISNWRLNSDRPVQVDGKVAAPYRWASEGATPSARDFGGNLPEPHFVSVVAHEPVAGLLLNSVSVSIPANFAELPEADRVVVALATTPVTGEEQRDPRAEPLRGVSLLDAALLVNEGDETAAKETKKRWQRTQGCPAFIGYDINQPQTELFEVGPLAEWIVTLGENGQFSQKSFKDKLNRIRRPCREAA